MSGFLNADGSALVGGLTTLGVGQAFQLDAAGSLKVNGGGNPVTNPMIAQDQLRAWLLTGQSYCASTGLISAATATNNYPLSIFNPAVSGKNILIYSLQVTNGSGALTALVAPVTANPAFSNVAAVANARAGGSASVLASTVTTTTISQFVSGPYVLVATVVSGTLELLTNSAGFLLPAGSANGLVVYIQTYNTGLNSITARWIEF